jgi:hypothetical protein
VCLCNRSYPARNAHASYYQIVPARLFSIFQHYLINGTIKKNVTEHIMCVLFPLQLVFETFLILRRNERDTIKNLYLSWCKVPVIFVQL